MINVVPAVATTVALASAEPEVGDRAALTRGRRAEATLSMAVEREGIFALERFIDSLDFTVQTECSRLKLAGSEIYDNLVKHASPVEGGMATVMVSCRHGRTANSRLGWG